MAMITQSGVDLLTRGTRAQFAAENKARQRKRRLAQAASGNYQFDPSEAATETERLRQQQEDLNVEGQGVRDRYATDPVFRGPTQLFDASNIMDLPASTLVENGRMSDGEMVRTEKQRIEGGGRGGWTFDPETGQTKSNGWDNFDEYTAGGQLGSYKMMGDAQAAQGRQDAPGLASRNKLAQANAANAARAERARNVVAFDQAVASGNTPADNALREKLAGRERPMFSNRGSTEAIRSRLFGDFGDTGGTISKGGEQFTTAPGTVGAPKYRAPARTTSALSPALKSDSFMPKGVGQTYEATDYPDPYAGLESMPRPQAPRAPVAPPVQVIDQRYPGSPSSSRTGAKALTAPLMNESDVQFTRDHPNLKAVTDLADMRSFDPWTAAASGVLGAAKNAASKPGVAFDVWAKQRAERMKRWNATRERNSGKSGLYGSRSPSPVFAAPGY